VINVTKTFLPPFEEYSQVLKRAWDKGWITNNGELVQELEASLKAYLGVKHLFFTTNGTIVLQMAIKALDLTGQVITTPFSYVATTNSILWEGCQPIFADIDPDSFCIDPDKIEPLISSETKAILATHVYGMPCDIEGIHAIADRNGLKVIYDGAHAFGTVYKGKQLLSYGDISTCSFHATKIFHTVEGGCIITNNDEIARKLMLYRQFGHIGDEYFSVGINAKNSEFHAAMGISNLKYIQGILEKRKELFDDYSQQLKGVDIQLLSAGSTDLHYNHSYFPVVFSSAGMCSKVIENLNKESIYPRRYFYPSLSKLPFLETLQSTPVSNSIADRVICLPLYHDLDKAILSRVCDIIKATLSC